MLLAREAAAATPGNCFAHWAIVQCGGQRSEPNDASHSLAQQSSIPKAAAAVSARCESETTTKRAVTRTQRRETRWLRTAGGEVMAFAAVVRTSARVRSLSLPVKENDPPGHFVLRY